MIDIPETVSARLPDWIQVVDYRLPQHKELCCDKGGFIFVFLKSMKCEHPKFILEPKEQTT